MYLIITEKNICHPGDERSRTHPGHGYPEWFETVSIVSSFTDYKQFEQAIQKLEAETYSRTKYVAYEAKPTSVTKSVSINIS